MDLRQLRYFTKVVDAGSISRAADMLSIVQPSLSLQIKSLEDELGVKLFIRHVRGVSPTDQGRLLYDYARRILLEVDRAKEIVQSATASPRGQISVGVPTSACRGLAIHLISAARKRFPNLSVRILEAMTATLEELMESGKLDVALIYNQKASENVAWTEMITEDLMVIAPRNALIAGHAEIEFAELAELPLVLPDRPNVLRIVVERLAARNDVNLNVLVDCDSLPTIAQLVRTGYVTVMPHFAFNVEIDSGEFVAIPVIDPVPHWRLSVVLSKRTLNMPGANAVAGLMAETINDLVSQGIWRARVNRYV